MAGSTAPDEKAAPATDPAPPENAPLVSLGLPVYNGANFLRAALESILAQTYDRWELIISDNGSTDDTPAICSEYAARDGRIRYYRHPVNMGATRNFNFTVSLAKGTFFRWTAHDDVCAPELLERCVAGLLAHPEAVLCHPRTRVIGPDGAILFDYAVRLRTDSPRVEERYGDLISVDHACFAIFGLMRTALLRRTPLLGAFVGSDRNLLAELALHGPFHEIPEFLFQRRDHPQTSTRQFPNAAARLAWFTGGRASGFPTLRRGYGYLASLVRTPLTFGERAACLWALARWWGGRFASGFQNAWSRLCGALRALRGPRPGAALLLGPDGGKCYTSVESHEPRFHRLRVLPGDVQRLDEGVPLLRGRARPSGP